MANAGPVDPGLVNDDFASLPASQPVAFANPAAAIGQAARITCRIYHPESGQTVVESNVIVPLLASRRRRAHDSSTDSSSSDDDDEDGDDDQMNDNDHPPTNKRAYWIQRTIRKAIYGKVKMGVVLRARNVVSTSNTPEAEWEVTSEPCAIKEMEWSRIRSARGRLAENPIGEVGALHYMQQLTKDQQQNPQHVLVPLDLLSDDQFLYLISPFCNGGELFDLLENREKFTEVEARYWMKQVLLVRNTMRNSPCSWLLCYLLAGLTHHFNFPFSLSFRALENYKPWDYVIAIYPWKTAWSTIRPL